MAPNCILDQKDCMLFSEHQDDDDDEPDHDDDEQHQATPTKIAHANDNEYCSTYISPSTIINYCWHYCPHNGKAFKPNKCCWWCWCRCFRWRHKFSPEISIIVRSIVLLIWIMLLNLSMKMLVSSRHRLALNKQAQPSQTTRKLSKNVIARMVKQFGKRDIVVIMINSSLFMMAQVAHSAPSNVSSSLHHHIIHVKPPTPPFARSLTGPGSGQIGTHASHSSSSSSKVLIWPNEIEDNALAKHDESGDFVYKQWMSAHGSSSSTSNINGRGPGSHIYYPAGSIMGHAQSYSSSRWHASSNTIFIIYPLLIMSASSYILFHTASGDIWWSASEPPPVPPEESAPESRRTSLRREGAVSMVSIASGAIRNWMSVLLTTNVNECQTIVSIMLICYAFYKMVC